MQLNCWCKLGATVLLLLAGLLEVEVELEGEGEEEDGPGDA